MMTATNTKQRQDGLTASALCLLFYAFFGLLHEACHIVASRLWSSRDVGQYGVTPTDLLRALLGRYALIPTDDEECHDGECRWRRLLVVHSAWFFSVLLAVVCHAGHCQIERRGRSDSWLASPLLPYAAYITAMEAIATDLLGWIPQNSFAMTGAKFMICYCGNFGIILLNPGWLAIDGGRTALNVLEKMVEVTMMRGAQSGGVVTFEPTHYSSILPAYTSQTTAISSSSTSVPPSLRGIRSRTINAKRSTLSRRIVAKIKQDNCTPFLHNIRGWNKTEYNVNANRLIRAFFGHTRFATSSKASFDGTHPHLWSERRVYKIYHGSSTSYRMGVENYITHNGDFEFFKVNGKYYDVAVLQQWLQHVLQCPMPATVDSAAIAGVIDLIRTQGSFALSARYALCLEGEGVKVEAEPAKVYLTVEEYEMIASFFEDALEEMLRGGDDGVTKSLEDCSSNEMRNRLVSAVVKLLLNEIEKVSSAGASHSSTVRQTSKKASRAMAIEKLSQFIPRHIEQGSLAAFVRVTIDAFFDNDLLHSTRLFLENAKGSFGLCVVSSLDAWRQVCFAARGQTLSVAFYPKKGLICYGSEQAAVKAGLNYENPGGNIMSGTDKEADNAVRLDLDDLGGEICLLDWGSPDPAISPPNRSLKVNKVMNGSVSVVLLHQSKMFKGGTNLCKRMILLENNEFIKPLLDDFADPVLKDIHDIPRVCSQIQEDWHDVGLNRMTAWNLANCIRSRLKARIDGRIECHGGQVDILVTGCEVSLWVAENFVSDLQKSFPKLFIKAVSSNKLLGLFGQELAMPCTGFPYSQKSMDLNSDPIVIIVSHSGGTFGPLACSNLLQSFSSSIFAVTSEWDTQIGKQLRSMYSDDLLSSRIFSTECGVRPAEPCSVSVVATHQLLTNIFEHICITIISDPHFSHVSGTQITERDLQTLERCNQENIKALEEIVGVDRDGNEIHERRSQTERELRSAGDLWSEHILENAKAYIMSFIYIVATVTSGYPLITGIATAIGLKAEWAHHLTRFFDSLIYFWLPQINIIILRIFQGRNWRHRMVGRTVVIGDCPWVAQAAEAFLSKIFACSYSIAGLNVLSGNPSDHLVHRHTHRVVRGSLLVCGRPDGRLPALTSLEASCCLSVNQASSIQSIGGTCESITIGHNKSKLPLSHKAIYLKSHRPLFLSEKVLDDLDVQEDLARQRNEKLLEKNRRTSGTVMLRRAISALMDTARSVDRLEISLSRSRQAKVPRSSASLLGAYVNLEKEARRKRTQEGDNKLPDHVSDVISAMIKERQGIENARRFFNKMDPDGKGVVELKEFIEAYQNVDPTVTCGHLHQMFDEADIDEDGKLTFDEFLKVSNMPNLLAELAVKNRDHRGLVQVQASKERYFGEDLRKHVAPGVESFAMSASQHFSMELYESRIASMQRFVAMTVMFHQMGMRVQSFFPKISFGLLGYRMDRTHSIMRIATTASPVSGADVRERMDELRLMIEIDQSVRLICRTWKKWKAAQQRLTKTEAVVLPTLTE